MENSSAPMLKIGSGSSEATNPLCGLSDVYVLRNFKTCQGTEIKLKVLARQTGNVGSVRLPEGSQTLLQYSRIKAGLILWKGYCEFCNVAGDYTVNHLTEKAVHLRHPNIVRLLTYGSFHDDFATESPTLRRPVPRFLTYVLLDNRFSTGTVHT